ncbi:hypothetical protein SUDANB120_06097 [Streptomyces sp. enrichment culture]|uniref:hypothetical protein n=1 Tax=Streptomyces TaxID=1883 RepID=UPI001676FEC5|nr:MULTISPECIES: hypothetical protein [Streptomyces]MBD3577523.1 hypothetical protein [Streptomyces sp. KD18]
MGNSVAYPVLRTTDAAEAYTQAKRLCALMAERDDETGLFAELRTVADVRKIAEVLPEAGFEYPELRTGPAGEHLWFDLDVTTADDAALGPHLPLDVMVHVPKESVEERFVAALGRGMAAIDWHGSWPDEPQAGHHGSPKYDGVQVVFHGDDAQWGRWAEHHTVFVHTGKFGDLLRARKLAGYIGSDVLGEPQTGW